MRKLFLFATLLFGCAHTYEAAPGPFDKPEPPPAMIAYGTNGTVEWKCEVEDLNDKLVWIPCEFHNRKSDTITSCITVTFYEERTMTPVVESRKICSGPLSAFEIKANYAAFIKEKRAALQQCGERLNSCVMLASRAD